MTDSKEHLLQHFKNFDLFVDCYQGHLHCFYSDVGFKQIFCAMISHCGFVDFPHSWWQNTQKLQIIVGTTEPQLNEVSRRLHRETSPSDKSHRTTAGVLFPLHQFGCHTLSCTLAEDVCMLSGGHLPEITLPAALKPSHNHLSVS